MRAPAGCSTPRATASAPGAVVTLRAPLGAAAEPVEHPRPDRGVRRPGRIEIRHDQPWRGRLRLLFDPDGQRHARAADRRPRRRRPALAHAPPRVRRARAAPTGATTSVGLLTSKSGPGQRVRRRHREPRGDGRRRDQRRRRHPRAPGAAASSATTRTDPRLGSPARRGGSCQRGCRTIMASTTSATFARRRQTSCTATGVLLVHALMNEGGLGGDRCRMQLGERPRRQLRAAAGPVMDAAGGRRWFLAGNDYVWPQVVHAAARRVVDEQRRHRRRRGVRPARHPRLRPARRAGAGRPGADVVLSSFVGADLVAFERQCHAMGRARPGPLAGARARRTHPRTDRRRRRHGHVRRRRATSSSSTTTRTPRSCAATAAVRRVRPAGLEHLGVGLRGAAPVRGRRPPRRGGRARAPSPANCAAAASEFPRGTVDDRRPGDGVASSCSSPRRTAGGFVVSRSGYLRAPPVNVSLPIDTLTCASIRSLADTSPTRGDFAMPVDPPDPTHPRAASPSATGWASPTPTSTTLQPDGARACSPPGTPSRSSTTPPRPAMPERAWTRPDAADNPFNAWYVTTSITEGGEGPLAGKTVAVKDNTAVAGVPMMNGSKTMEGYVPLRDATDRLPACSPRARRSPARRSARTSASPAARTPPAPAPVRNPWDETRSAGGSSSGSAALVAAGRRRRRHRRRPGRLDPHPGVLLAASSGTSRPGAWCPTPARSRSSRPSTTSAR